MENKDKKPEPIKPQTEKSDIGTAGSGVRGESTNQHVMEQKGYDVGRKHTPSELLDYLQAKNKSK